MKTVKMGNTTSTDPDGTITTASSSSSIFLALAGSKHKRKLGATLNESAATGPNDFAKRQLEKLGWTEGTGLGKKRHGRSTHIRVQPREIVESGLGSHHNNVNPIVSADQWWKSTVGHTLAKLSSSNSNKNKEKKKKKKSKKDKKKTDQTKLSSSSSSSLLLSSVESTKPKKLMYTDEELFQATGGVRFGMRAQTQQHSKWKRTESNISKEQEQEAKQKTEWNGLAAPRVVLKLSSGGDSSSNTSTTNGEKESNHNNKRKRSRESETDTTSLPPPPPSNPNIKDHEVYKSRTKKQRKGNDDDKDSDQKDSKAKVTTTKSKQKKEKRKEEKKKTKKKKNKQKNLSDKCDSG